MWQVKAGIKDHQSNAGGRVKSTPPRRAAPAKAHNIHWLQVALGYEGLEAEASFYKAREVRPC